MTKRSLKLSALLLVLLFGALTSSSVFAANVVIENADAPSSGLNDPTPVSPIGGNTGTTVGQQRLIALQRAASIWGETLVSGPTITIRVTWTALSCDATQGALASAGNFGTNSGGVWRDFGAVPGTWYGNALANALSGIDRNGSSPEMQVQFNVNLGNGNCFAQAHWYYGLDTNHPADGINLVSVALHEFGHGLGFQTYTNSINGAQLAVGGGPGFPSIYDRFLLDNTTGKLWPEMTNAERAASAINTTHLVWNGPKVKADVPGYLKSPVLKVNSPAAIAGNYEVGLAEFGPAPSSPGVTGGVVQALDVVEPDAGSTSTDGCSDFANPGAIAGKIALIDRGICTFVVKVTNAQDAGAVGVIIVNNVDASTPPGMAGSDSSITIPTVSITRANGDSIKAQLATGVNASLLLDPSVQVGADSAGRLRMFAPNPFVGGSSVSHWDTVAFPNLLMEPEISVDLTHGVTFPFDLTASLMSDLGWALNVTNTLQLSANGFSVNENAGNAQITVIRTDTNGAATVDYLTSDSAALNECNVMNGAGSSRCDYATSIGTLRFAAGEGSKTIFVPIVDDGYAEGNETFTVTLSNPTGTTLGATTAATVTIQDNDSSSGANPIDGNDFFIRQQYIDFLG
ncbi:MAG TPA: PA domain-containing protein, partial [Pyrinomonadaceae bacterium]|nr:PA domain-containing protein [Pyrinomonadaceae bacterium]